MIEVQITPEMIVAAKERMVKHTLKDSLTNGAGNYVGALGEIIAAAVMGLALAESFDFDLENRIEVKSKEVTTEPQAHYACTVNRQNCTQNCAAYVFVRILSDHTRAWVLGQITPARFRQVAKLNREGDIDPGNGHKFKADCYEVSVDQLVDVMRKGALTDKQLDGSFDDYMASKGEKQPWRDATSPKTRGAGVLQDRPIEGNPFGRVRVAQRRPWGS